MNKKMSISISVVVLLCIIATFIFIIDINYPLFPDEFNYSHITWTNHRLTGIRDIITSQKLLYANWSGRVIVLGLAQLFLFLGKWIYDILNSFIFIGLIYLILKLRKNSITYLNIAIVASILFLFIIDFGESVFWLSGSVNYLWPSFFMLLFILEFNKIYDKNKKMLLVDRIKILLLAFLSGACQENTTFLVGAWLFLYFIFNFKNIKISKEKITLLLTYILFGAGATLLLLAPGNFKRAGSGLGIHFNQFIENLYQIRYVLLLQIAIIIILYIIKKKDKITISFKYFIFPAFLSLMPMLVIPEFPTRALFPFCIFLFITISDGLITFIEEKVRNDIKIILAIFFSIYIAFFCLPFTYFFMTKVIPYNEQTHELINKQKENNQDNAVVYKLEIPEKYKKMLNIQPSGATSNSNSIYNKYFSTYYGFKSMNAIKPEYSLIELEIVNEDKYDAAYQIFWSNRNEYNAEQCGNRISPVLINPGTENEMNGIVQLEAPLDNIKKLRIDFPSHKTIQLKSITIKTIYGTQKYNYDEILNKIDYKNQLDNINLKDGYIEFNTSDDTYFEIKLL